MILEIIVTELLAGGMGWLVTTIPGVNTTWGFVVWALFACLYGLSNKLTRMSR